jgi:hypothetical protein
MMKTPKTRAIYDFGIVEIDLELMPSGGSYKQGMGDSFRIAINKGYKRRDAGGGYASIQDGNLGSKMKILD